MLVVPVHSGFSFHKTFDFLQISFHKTFDFRGQLSQDVCFRKTFDFLAFSFHKTFHFLESTVILLRYATTGVHRS